MGDMTPLRRLIAAPSAIVLSRYCFQALGNVLQTVGGDPPPSRPGLVSNEQKGIALKATPLPGVHSR